MSVPKFSDINKLSNDLIGKDFPVGNIKLETETKAADGVKFTVTGTRDNVSGGINGDLKHKYSSTEGLDVTTTITTASVLTNKIELKDAVIKGLKLDLEGSLVSPGKYGLKFGYEAKQDYFTSTANVDIFKGPNVNVDLVAGSDGIFVGSELGYDTKAGSISKTSSSVAYHAHDYTVSLNALNFFNTFSAVYYHRLSSEVEVGGKATVSIPNEKKPTSEVGLELGSKWTIDKSLFVKAKIDNVGKLGLSLRQQLRPGVKVTLGTSIDTLRLNENAHRIGLGINFEG